MLNAADTKVVDTAWRHVWSNGITNPIIVSEVLATALMLLKKDAADALSEAMKSHDPSDAAAGLVAEVRREFGLPPGAEIESASFWAKPALLADVTERLGAVGGLMMSDDVLGDAYEHVLSKLSTAGHFGQFRTPRHIVDLMVNIVAPSKNEVVLDPACGSGGFLVSASAYRGHRDIGQLIGWEIDRTVARVAMSNVLFHGMPPTDVHVQDGLADSDTLADVVLANPPFAGEVNKKLAGRFHCGSGRSEVLFVEAIARLLNKRGRAAVIVPTGVLDGKATASVSLRRWLMETRQVTNVIELPSAVFRPYADVRTAILVIGKAGRTQSIRMVKVGHDGFSPDARRREQPEKSDLPFVESVVRGGDSDRVKHIDVSADEISAYGFNLTPSRWIRESASDQSGLGVDETVQLLADTSRKLTKTLRQIERLTR